MRVAYKRTNKEVDYWVEAQRVREGAVNVHFFLNEHGEPQYKGSAQFYWAIIETRDGALYQTRYFQRETNLEKDLSRIAKMGAVQARKVGRVARVTKPVPPKWDKWTWIPRPDGGRHDKGRDYERKPKLWVGPVRWNHGCVRKMLDHETPRRKRRKSKGKKVA